MPWKETTWMDQRMRFVADVTSCRYTMSELCRLYGISRKTGYKWAQRYGEEGVDGLKERSRRPHRCPRQTEARCEEALVAERRAHPRWGARKQRRSPTGAPGTHLRRAVGSLPRRLEYVTG